MERDLLELLRREPARGVRADGVERDVPEVEQAAVADDDVEADRHHRERDHHDDRPGRRHEVADQRQVARASSTTTGRAIPSAITAGHQPSARARARAPRARVRDAAHAPSGVRSPSRPSGRNTSTAIRIPKTIERVQSPPGAYQVEALVERLDEPDHDRADDGAREVADAAEHGRGERDQAELEAGVVAHVVLEEEDEPGDRGERAREEERHRDRPVDVDAHHRRRLGVLRDGAHRLALPRRAHEPAEHDERGNDDRERDD